MLTGFCKGERLPLKLFSQFMEMFQWFKLVGYVYVPRKSLSKQFPLPNHIKPL